MKFEKKQFLLYWLIGNPMLIYVWKLNYVTLIKRGGGKGPCETRQPVLYKVPIPVDIFLQDKKSIAEIALFLLKSFFILVKLSGGILSFGYITCQLDVYVSIIWK